MGTYIEVLNYGHPGTHDPDIITQDSENRFVTDEQIASWGQPGENGETVDRPINDLYVGLMFFDSTLLIPIWWSGVNWVNAVGSIV